VVMVPDTSGPSHSCWRPVTPADWELREPTAFRLPVRRNRYGGSSAGSLAVTFWAR
jgi:hypothetical protein